MDYTASFSKTSTALDSLIVDEDSIESRQITLISGQNALRGAVLGKITASGKYNLSLSAAGDGSQTPDAILANDTDASGGDKVTVAYFKGGFNQRQVILGTGHTIASIREGLRQKDIHLRDVQITY
jgi:hypothetical protein